ncbi:unnamed protein product [Rotaria socialis]|uniref:Uncharacterized protein n=1 Tax=Rotaria socialis TaxID=392032 RepID=A0A821X6J6_9BILA|nr:unnamed protein product [Rotaria socialis]
MGEKAAPEILDRFKDTFTDSVTKEPYMFIYVFCLNIKYNREWALDYCDYIQMFNFEAELLAHAAVSNNPIAYHRLTWAHELFHRYSQLEKISMKTERDEINRLLEQVENESRSSSDDDSC